MAAVEHVGVEPLERMDACGLQGADASLLPVLGRAAAGA